MASDALFPIRTAGAGEMIGPLAHDLRWAKADLGRFLGRGRPTVSRWAHGKRRVPEREAAAIRFLRRAADVEREEGDIILRSHFGEWALPLGIRGLVAARFQKLGELEEKRGGPERNSPLLSPRRVRKVRGALGWTQAETAAFFGVTHSTPAKWEDTSLEDPRVGPATEAELLALRWHAEELRAGQDEDANGAGIRDLWQEGVSHFMTEMVGWTPGILPESYA